METMYYAFIHWLKPRIMYIVMKLFTKRVYNETFYKPTSGSARFYAYMEEKRVDLDHEIEVIKTVYHYPKIQKIRDDYNMIYEIINAEERLAKKHGEMY